MGGVCACTAGVYLGESTLFVDGQEFGTYWTDWIAKSHHYLVDNTIAINAQPGKSYQIAMETYAGHDFPDCGSCATGPVLPGSYSFGGNEGKQAELCSKGSCGLALCFCHRPQPG